MSLSLVTAYLIDLSFENPAARRPTPPQGPTSIEKTVSVNAASRPDGHFNVDTCVRATVTAGSEAAFLIELTYRAVVSVAGATGDELERLLLVEGGQASFPPMAELVKTMVAVGGYDQPFQLDPIDFDAIFRSRHSADQAA
ncbi:MAG: protein-export chaperone SecB [Pseudomonadota bacterium]